MSWALVEVLVPDGYDSDRYIDDVFKSAVTYRVVRTVVHHPVAEPEQFTSTRTIIDWRDTHG